VSITVNRTKSQYHQAPGGWPTFKELFLELCLCDFNLDRLVNLLVMAALVIGVVFDGRGEEGVNESGLAESRLAGHLDGLGVDA
jgi:hypothetical protein